MCYCLSKITTNSSEMCDRPSICHTQHPWRDWSASVSEQGSAQKILLYSEVHNFTRPTVTLKHWGYYSDRTTRELQAVLVAGLEEVRHCTIELFQNLSLLIQQVQHIRLSTAFSSKYQINIYSTNKIPGTDAIYQRTQNIDTIGPNDQQI